MRSTLIASLLTCTGLCQACVANASGVEASADSKVVAATAGAECANDCCATGGSSVSVTKSDGNVVAVCETDSPRVFTITKDGNVTVTGAPHDAKDNKVIFMSPDGAHELKAPGKAFKIILEKDGEPQIVELAPGEAKANVFTLRSDKGGAWTAKGDGAEVFELKGLPRGKFKFEEMPKGDVRVFSKGGDDHVVFMTPEGDFDWKKFVPDDARKWIDEDMQFEIKTAPKGRAFFFSEDGDAPKARAFAFRGENGEPKARTFVFKGDHDAPAAPEAAPADRPRLGVMLEEGDGALKVSGVMDGLPAEGAGVKEGDMIVAINGAKPASMDRLRKALGASEITLTVKRDGATKDVTVKLGAGEGGSKWRARVAPNEGDQKREEIILREKAPKAGGGNWVVRGAPKGDKACDCDCCDHGKSGGVAVLRGPMGLDKEARAKLEKHLGEMREELHQKRGELGRLQSELRGKMRAAPLDKQIIIELKKGLDDAREAMEDIDIDFDIEIDPEMMEDVQRALKDAMANVEINIDQKEIQRSIEEAMKELKNLHPLKDGEKNVIIRRAPEARVQREMVEKELREVERHRAEAEAHRRDADRHRAEAERHRAEVIERQRQAEWRARENAPQPRNPGMDARLKRLEERMERIEELLRKISREG